MKVLVTGGSAGLGAAFVAVLLNEGANVVTVDRTLQQPRENLQHIDCDLADRDAVDQTLAAIVAAGPYDLAVFNAGVSATGRFVDIPLNAQLRLLRINTEAPIVTAAALARRDAMLSGSNMVFVSSLSHFTGYPGAAAYAASKDAIAVYAKSIRKPFRQLGITVSTAFPGPLRTAHAALHAPPDADAEQRMEPDVAARLILDDVRAGKHTIIPGRRAKAFALAGLLAPAFVTRQMRKLIFDRLTGPVW